MNKRLSLTFSIALILVSIWIPSCIDTAITPVGTSLAAPSLDATPVFTVTELSPSAVQSQTPKPVLEAKATVAAPSGLHIVYLRDGNLWSWKEAEENVMLTGTGDMTTARLSEDGQLLAFMRGREVWTVGMDGTNASSLVTQESEGGALWFAPNGSLLAVSTTDHIDVIDLKNATIASVVTYSAISNGYYPEVIWSPDSSGFKTVVPPGVDTDKAEFLFVFADRKKASLAKFAMASLSEGSPFISPDGGYIIYAGKTKDGKEALILMDSSGAAKPYGDSAESIRAYGWLPDSKHFAYFGNNQEKSFLGDVTGEPPVEILVEKYETLRWLDMERYLALHDGALYLGDITGEKSLIAEDVTDFDFEL